MLLTLLETLFFSPVSLRPRCRSQEMLHLVIDYGASLADGSGALWWGNLFASPGFPYLSLGSSR